MSELNRYGQCPNCEKGWDGGDILEALSKLDVFKTKTPNELLHIAAENYGYSVENKTRFTNLNSIEVEGRAFWQCPTCNHVWDKFTSEHFNSLKIAIAPYSQFKNYTVHVDDFPARPLTKHPLEMKDDTPFDID